MARLRTDREILERSGMMDCDGREVRVQIRIGPARAWFERAESQEPRWLVIELSDGQVLALALRLGP